MQISNETLTLLATVNSHTYGFNRTASSRGVRLSFLRLLGQQCIRVPSRRVVLPLSRDERVRVWGVARHSYAAFDQVYISGAGLQV